MRSGLLGLGLAALVAGYACGPPAPFLCENDQQCTGDGSGLCTLSGWCTYADVSCVSGRRYAELAGDGLGGACVSMMTAGTGSGSAGTADTNANDDDSPTDTDNGTTSGGSGSAATGTDDGGDTEPAESAGTPEDPYGRCEPGCGFQDAACLQTEDDGTVYRMCAPPCEVQASPSDACPAALGDGYSVGCLGTGPKGGNACFIECAEDGSCPNGMICALSTVCSWL